MHAATLEIGDQHLNAGHFLEALTVYHSVLQASPRNAAAWHRAGIAAHCVGRFADSVFLLQRSLELERNSAALWSDCAMAINSLGQYELALTAAHQAVNLDAARSDSYLYKGIAESGLKLHWTAIASLSRALTLNPSHSVASAALSARVVGLAPISAPRCRREERG